MTKVKIKNKDIIFKSVPTSLKQVELTHNLLRYTCKNVVKVNGVEYFGEVLGEPELIATIQYLDYLAEKQKKQPFESVDHQDVCIGVIKGG